MITRRSAALGLALLVAGCATVPPPDLGVADLQRYRIVEVTVEGVEVIRSWPAEEEAFLATNPVGPELANRMRTESSNTFPELRAHFQRALTERLRLEFASQLASALAGPQPVRAVVRLRTFDIPSTSRRVFTDQDSKIQAEIDLVDARTGAVLLRYPGPFEFRRMVGGILAPVAASFEKSDVGQLMLTAYVSAYRNWLLRN